MTKERDDDLTLEEYLAQRKKYAALQKTFKVRPTFPIHEHLIAGFHEPDIVQFNEVIYDEKDLRGTSTNISQVEVVYPFLLERLGLIQTPLTKIEKEKNYEKEALIGQKLHLADTLFAIILQDLRGASIKMMLPTTDRSLIEKFDEATYKVRGGKIKSREDLEERLLLAWTNFHNSRGVIEDHAPRPLPGFGMKDPEKEQEIFYGDEMGVLGAKLAKAWVEEVFKAEPMTWEFRPDSLNQREVLVSMKFTGPNLMFRGRLDSVTRLIVDKKKGKVKSQIVDLKTGGKKFEPGTLAYEVDARQKQITLILAERFTAKFLKNFLSLESEKGIFATRSRHESKYYIDRLDKAGFRRFDKDRGEFTFETFEMGEEERSEFNAWFNWYGMMINKQKDEVKKVLKRKTRYNLDVKLKK